MNLNHKIKSFFITILDILKKWHLPFSKRMILLGTFLTIYIKRILDNRMLDFDNSIVGVVGFKVSVKHFEDFYRSFRDVFIEESYHFLTKKKDPFIIDGGGNIGLATIYFKWMYPNSKIIVFEPHPENFELLEKNISSNNLQDVELHNIALSDRKGSISLFGIERAATIIEGFLGRKDRWSQSYVENEVLVDTDKLSDYLNNNEVDLLKLDIEGAEGMVLKELSENYNMTSIKKIIMEFHYRASSQNQLSDIIGVFDDNNFATAFFSKSGGVSEMTMRDFTHLIIVAVPANEIILR